MELNASEREIFRGLLRATSDLMDLFYLSHEVTVTLDGHLRGLTLDMVESSTAETVRIRVKALERVLETTNRFKVRGRHPEGYQDAILQAMRSVRTAMLIVDSKAPDSLSSSSLTSTTTRSLSDEPPSSSTGFSYSFTSSFSPSRKAAMDRLRTITPEELIVPYEFDFRNDKLVVRSTAQIIQPDRAIVTERARLALKDEANRLLEVLLNANMNRHLCGSLNAVQEALSHNFGSVPLAMAAQSFQGVVRVVRPEIDEALFESLRQLALNVMSYVAQFDDWRQWKERAAGDQLDDDDEIWIANEAENISEALSELPELVDPEVPKSIRFLIEAWNRPGKAAKRAAFAIVSSIESLWATLFRHVVATADATLTKVSTAASVSIAGAIIVYATGLTSVLDKIPGYGWLIEGIHLVSKIFGN